MRLTVDEVASIKAAAAATFGPTAVVRLFGSRVHDHLHGGDVDLHLEVDRSSEELRQRFVRTLYDTIGERTIDVLVAPRGSERSRIDGEALRTGIVL